MKEYVKTLPIGSRVRTDEVLAMDQAARAYNTSRAGFIRLAIRFALENPNQVKLWFRRTNGQVMEERYVDDSTGNERESIVPRMSEYSSSYSGNRE